MKLKTKVKVYFLLVAVAIASSTCSSGEPDSKKLFPDIISDLGYHDSEDKTVYFKADSLKWLGAYHAAARDFKNFINKHPNHVDSIYCYNQLTFSLLNSYQYTEAEQYIERIKAKSPFFSPVDYADFKYNQALLFESKNQGIAMKEALEKALFIYNKHYDEDHLKIFLTNTWMGHYYRFYSEDLDSMNHYITKAYNISLEQEDLEPYSLYNRFLVSDLSWIRRDFELGLATINQALAIEKKQPFRDTLMRGLCLSLKGRHLMKEKQDGAAKEHYKKAIEFVESMDSIPAKIQLLYKNLANHYARKSDLKDSFLITINKIEQRFSADSIRYVSIDHLMAVHLKFGQKEGTVPSKEQIHQTIQAFKNAENFIANNPQSFPIIRYQCSYHLTDLNKKLCRYEAAAQPIISSLCRSKQSNSKKPTIGDVLDLTSFRRDYAFIDLAQLANLFTLSYERSKKVKHLNYAFQLHVKIDSLIYKNASIERENIILNFTKDYVWNVYSNAVRVCSYLYEEKQNRLYLDKMNDFIERQKYTYGYKNAQLINKAKDYNIPEQWMQHYIEIKKESSAILKSEKLNQNQEKRLQILLEKESKFLTRIKEAHPVFYNRQLLHHAPSIDEIQKSLLKKNQSILQFHISTNKDLGETFNFQHRLLLINKDTVIEHTFEADSILDKNIEYFKHLTARGNPTDAKQIPIYIQQANELYQKLLDPLEEYFKDELIIIPSNKLNGVVFEALLTSKKGTHYQNFPYLIHEKKIKYLPTLKLLTPPEKHPLINSSPKILAYAYSDMDDNRMAALSRDSLLKELPGSPLELKSIENYFQNGDLTLRYGTESKKDDFLKHSNEKYDILHLASHASSDPNNRLNNKIYFKPSSKEDKNKNTLYGYEIASLGIKCDLAVLSACETAAGTIHKGEGVFSLSNTFLQAGAKNVISSHWKINDDRTSVLMEIFYKNLSQGLSPSEALHQAKKQYIKTEDQYLAHPRYWSPMVSWGNH